MLTSINTEIFMAEQKECHHFATDLLPADDPFRSMERYMELSAQSSFIHLESVRCPPSLTSWQWNSTFSCENRAAPLEHCRRGLARTWATWSEIGQWQWRRGRLGRLVPVGDVDALKGAIFQALDRPPPVERLRRRASEFSLEGSVDRYLQVLLGNHVA